jgi:DNA-binding NtrC family response regulator
MKKEIVVLDADKEHCLELCAMLGDWNYQATPLHSIQNLEIHIQESTCQAVIVDLDTVSIDNRITRELTKKNPMVHFFCMSKERFHPEIKEAISDHFFACLTKPIDPDELAYWLRSICEDETENKNHPSK